MFKAMIPGAAAFAAAGCAGAVAVASPADLAALQRVVFAAERPNARTHHRAIARSMPERDHAAFTGHLSEQAVFFGMARVLQGRRGQCLEGLL